jgi:acetyl esterase/lipase
LFLLITYSLQRINRKITVVRRKLQTNDGSTFKVDIFTPKGKKTRPCLLYFPGGGFLMCATPFHKKILADLVAKLDISAVMVHYRLAPRHPFPAAFNDAVSALEYVIKHADRLSIDPNHIGVGGDSAGGTLAAGLSLYNNDKLHYQLKCSMLIYPATDNEDSKSRQAYVDTPMFHSRMLEVVKKAYFANGLFGLGNYAFPLQHPNPKGLGPTYIETAEFDPLHDEGIHYHKKLAEFGVVTELNNTIGTVHGYDIVQKSEIVKNSMKKRILFIQEHL